MFNVLLYMVPYRLHIYMFFCLSVCLFSREGQYRYKPGTTAVLTKTVTPLSLDVIDQSVQVMDTE